MVHILAKKLILHSPELRVINLKFHEKDNPIKVYFIKSDGFSDLCWTVTGVIKANCSEISNHDMPWWFCEKVAQTGVQKC